MDFLLCNFSKRYRFMKQLYSVVLILVLSVFNPMSAQQLPNAGFEDWSGEKYDGNIQLKDWYASNVTQVGFKFNFAHREAGHSGNYSMMVQDQEVGAMGITEPAPGYFSLGHPWTYLPSITEIGKATAGTYGGISWKYRPDTMSVWIKRTGNNTDKEDFYLLYYAWSGTAKGSKYRGKDGGCTSISHTNEESDIRIALDENECGSDQKGDQIAEGMWRERKTYGEWTNIRVPIYYMNNNIPTMMNVIFSASNYPNFRANDGLYVGNSLYVDDVELIYSSKIQKLTIGGKEWKGFNPKSTEEQIYSLGKNAESIPDIKAYRGIGTLTNARGKSVNFLGRELSGNEITINKGEIDGAPTTITVKSEDGKSSTTYKLKFVRQASNNASLASILVNDQVITNFNPELLTYTIELPFGTSQAPVVSVDKQEDEQVVEITQATSVTGTATIKVTAADTRTTKTYTIAFKVGQLSDNTLKDILINDESLPGFTPNQPIYRVSLPTSTTTMPTIRAISAYPDGAQTIEYIQPSTIDGGTYQIKVSSPGNPTPKIYKLTFKLEASSYSYLKDLQMGENLINAFKPEQTTYYVNLPIGTSELPAITYIKGESTQQVTITEGGLNGMSKVNVVAGNGINTTEYKISVSTAVSEISTLNMIYVGGEALDGFNASKISYTYILPIGTTEFPEITFDKGDEYQSVSITTGGVNGVTRITVIAGNGNTTQYQITFKVQQATNASLKMIYLDGAPLQDFNPEILEYDCPLPQGTTQLPVITYEQSDEYQTVTVRSGGINGDYRITVRPQSGASQTYVLHFSVATSDNAALAMIYIDGQEIDGFSATQLEYIDTLPMGVTNIPTVTYQKGDDSQKVFSLLNNNVHTLTVTAESGTTSVYTITFIIQRSESAFLKMIKLDGDSLEGFDPNIFSYSVHLEEDRCPTITAEKEEGQQITIISPHGAGSAQIYVKPETASGNVYTIEFIGDPSTNTALLDSIFVNGELLENFSPTIFDYEVTYDNTLPIVTYAGAENQSVSVLRNKNIITLYVNTDTDKNQYTITLHHIESNSTSLRAIYIDNQPLANFSPEKKQYTIQVPAGQDIPSINYEKQDTRQSTLAGFIDATHYGITVTAINGDTTQYVLTFDKQKYNDATLLNIEVEGMDINFSAEQLEYSLTLAKGRALPGVHVQSRDKQHVGIYTASATEQNIVVTAEDGTSCTYKINYTYTTDNSAFLTDILLDGVSIANFHKDTTYYIDTLEWRTRVVPCVQPVGNENQIITTYHSAINETTHIHVESLDKSAKKDYYIHFPVRLSSNTALEYIDMDVPFNFHADSTEYVILLPEGSTAAPLLSYQGQEQEQTIRYINRPIGETSQLIVTAEDGSQRTYNLTFKATSSPAENILKSLRIIELDTLLDANITYHTINLPYGATAMTVAYEKMFDGQTVKVAPGGTKDKTTITVQSNRPLEPALVYTIVPQVSTQNPAVLDSILVDGELVTGFNKNRFSYIHNRSTTTTPNVTTHKANGTEVTTTCDLWHWTATINKDGYTNTYTIYFHYNNEKIPNNEFDLWTKTSSSNTDKPTYWNAPGDELDVYLETAKAGNTVSKDGNSAVHLKTTNWAALAGAVPAVINLGEMSSGFAVAGGTRVIPHGFISFHNTPDKARINYQYTDAAGDGALFRFKFYNLNGSAHVVDYRQKNEISSYSEVQIPLNTSGQLISGMDIIIDATGKYPTASYTANLYVDYVRFEYSSKLDSIYVNGIKTIQNGNEFTLDKPIEDDELPHLTFYGEVSDQAQDVSWSDETINGTYAVRNAEIINYAEDGTYTNYTLHIKRKLNQDAKLQGIRIDNISLPNFDKDSTNYTITLPSNRKTLPDIQPVLSNKHQRASISYKDSTYTIKVMTEYTAITKMYTIKFTSPLSSDTELAALSAEGITFDPAQREYSIIADKLPAIYFEKKMDGQTVALDNGVLIVTAEDGTIGTYRILLQKPTIQSNALLSEIEIDGLQLQGFDSNTFVYTIDKRPYNIGFKRSINSDSVIVEQTPTYVEIKVISADNDTTYTINFASAEMSDDATLHAITINGLLLDGFNPKTTDYTYYTDSATILETVMHERAQKLKVLQFFTDSCLLYQYVVTAEDGSIGDTYQLAIKPHLSNSSFLNDIRINGLSIPYFRSDSLSYTIILPADNAKEQEPTIPNIEYTTSAPHQLVELELGKLGETTNIIVTSEDKQHTSIYQLHIQAESSHNATLNSILINGNALQGFEPQRHFYSIQTQEQDVNITWASDDNFQTVTLTQDSIVYYLHVVAQDSVTTNTYQIEVYHLPVSSNATLSNVLLDGKPMTDFYPELNAQLQFSAMQQRYNINLPIGTTTMPEIAAIIGESGQQVQTSIHDWTIDMVVTAPDGISNNTYSFLFNVPLSNNTQLAMIYLDGDSLTGFTPNQYNYFVELPIGRTTMPTIQYVTQESTQHVETSITGDLQQTLFVTAQDSTQSQYMIVFNLTYSHADTLLAIYADGDTIPNFRPDSFYYSYILPVGTTFFPEIIYDSADEWQTVNVTTIQTDSLTTTTQLEVFAMSGRKNVYTIQYQIMMSTCDSLGMIYVKGDSLLNFQPAQQEYFMPLAVGDSLAPAISYDMGDEYQTVSDTLMPYTIGTTQLGWKRTIQVTAQNGLVRYYHLYFTFTKALSTDVTLKQIYINGEALDGYNSDNLNYLVMLQEEQPTPNVFVEKSHHLQTVSIERGDTTLIHVTAEDSTQHATYTIVFQRQLSEYALLEAIYINDTILHGFRVDSFQYDIYLPYGTNSLPTITYELGHPLQTVSTDTFNNEVGGQMQTTIRLTVNAPDQISASEYDLRFIFKRNDDCSLRTIIIKGDTLLDFHADTKEYTIQYPIGSDPTMLASVEDVIAIANDSNATILITESGSKITIQVTADDQKAVDVYTIEQQIQLSSNAYLQMIMLDSVPLRDFDPTITEYTYYINDVVPEVTVEAQDTSATYVISFPIPNEIYVTAADGTELTYTIHFVPTTIQSAKTPTNNDVLIKHIAGTMDFAVATIRKNVSIGIYTAYGQLVYYQKLTESSQNDVIMETYADGTEYLMDVHSTTTQFTLPSINQMYYYVFFENDERKIKSGKLYLTY